MRWSNKTKGNYIKMVRSTSEFGFRLFINFLLLHLFLAFKVVFKKLIVDLSIPFRSYCGDCFDGSVILFNYQICICELELIVCDNLLLL